MLSFVCISVYWSGIIQVGFFLPEFTQDLLPRNCRFLCCMWGTMAYIFQCISTTGTCWWVNQYFRTSFGRCTSSITNRNDIDSGSTYCASWCFRGWTFHNLFFGDTSFPPSTPLDGCRNSEAIDMYSGHLTTGEMTRTIATICGQICVIFSRPGGAAYLKRYQINLIGSVGHWRY